MSPEVIKQKQDETEAFIRAYIKAYQSKTEFSDFADSLGVTVKQAASMAARYRKMGIKLPYYYVTRKGKPRGRKNE